MLVAKVDFGEGRGEGWRWTALGRHQGRRTGTGISLVELLHMFPTYEAAEQWFTSIRWPDGVRCAHLRLGSRQHAEYSGERRQGDHAGTAKDGVELLEGTSAGERGGGEC